MRLFLLSVVALCVVLLSCKSTPPVKPLELTPSQRETILDRIRAEYLESALSASSIETILSTQLEDGTWPDIPYASTKRSPWEPTEHMNRIRHLSVAGYREKWTGEPARRKMTALEKALRAWYRKAPRSANWWYQTIGVPQIEVVALAFCEAVIPADLRRTIISDLRDAGAVQETYTGTNRTWIANNNFILALITNDPLLLAKSLAALTEEFRVSTAEGLQPDWSYHQHGPMLQTGNYGNSYLSTQTKLAALLAGTPAGILPEQVQLLTNYVLEHNRWLVWGGYFDISAAGRQLDSSNALSKKAESLAKTVAILAGLDADDEPALKAFVQATLARNTGTSPLGVRLWPRSDYLVSRQPGWTASLKMHSSRVMRVETWVNTENRLGSFLNHGATWFRVRGDEQENLQPLLDWRRIPGTTGRDTGDPLPLANTEADASRLLHLHNGGKAMVGALVKGSLAAAVMDLDSGGVSGRKAWFFLPEGVVCLGAGLGGFGPLFTSVNQAKLIGPVLTGEIEQGKTATELAPGSPGEFILGKPRLFWHDRIAYVIAPGQNIRLQMIARSNPWTVIRTNGSTDVVQGNVFQLDLLHKSARAGYEYAVLPGLDQNDAQARAFAPAWQVLKNSSDLQAVKWNSAEGMQAVLAVFWKAGALAFENTTVAVQEPCVLLLEQGAQGTHLSVTDPSQQQKVLRVRVNQSTHSIEMPQGATAGATVSITLP